MVRNDHISDKSDGKSIGAANVALSVAKTPLRRATSDL
jgi:hypothetical protein